MSHYIGDLSCSHEMATTLSFRPHPGVLHLLSFLHAHLSSISAAPAVQVTPLLDQ
jgi:hypothetical protein